MKRSVLGSVFLLATFPQPAATQAKAGSEAPDMKADLWLNFSQFHGQSLKQLRGSAVYLEYWQTW